MKLLEDALNRQEIGKVREMLNQHKMNFYEKYVKRFLDIIISFTVLVIFSPILLIVGLLVRINLGAPVLFKQARPGRNEEIFYMYKFRSMSDAKDENGELLPDSVRLTKFGRLLRSSSLDELPELFCILKGDMSLIGPRPLTVGYLPYYTDEERLRHAVRPGLTGLAQVNGRNNLSWEERFAYDIEYVNNISLKMDIQILLKTVGKVLKSEDIVVCGENQLRDFDAERKEKLNGN